MLVDTHCHIYNEYYEDIDSIMSKIKKYGINKVINNACNYKTSLEVKDLANKYEDMYYVLGVHPSENFDDIESVIQLIKDSVNDYKMVGIGEIGLDFYYGKDNKNEQITIFRKQLELAQKLNLPVIIHSRDATQDSLEILKDYNLRGIIHCFNGSLEIAKEYIKLGYKLGINGVVTFKNCKLIEVLKNISINDIVFETDSPYLTPVPNRGKKNDPSFVNDIIDYVSVNLDIDRDKLIEASYNSVNYVFNICA